MLDLTELTPSPQPPSTDGPASYRTTTAVLLVAAFLMILNETAMNVALSTIMSDLHIGERLAQWLTTAFMLTMATVIPATGWPLQNHTTRSVFASALTLFSSGTALCALAPTFGVLVTGRVVQAAGTALILPLLMTTIMLLIPSERRGQVMGTVSLVISVAPAVGPTISGIILQFLSWRFVFWLVLPLAMPPGRAAAHRPCPAGPAHLRPPDLRHGDGRGDDRDEPCSAPSSCCRCSCRRPSTRLPSPWG